MTATFIEWTITFWVFCSSVPRSATCTQQWHSSGLSSRRLRQHSPSLRRILWMGSAPSLLCTKAMPHRRRLDLSHSFCRTWCRWLWWSSVMSESSARSVHRLFSSHRNDSYAVISKISITNGTFSAKFCTHMYSTKIHILTIFGV